MRERIHSDQAAITFSGQLAENAQLYAALRNDDHEYWNRYGGNAKKHIHILNQLRVSQVRTLLLAVLDKFKMPDVKKVLSYAVSW